MNRTLLGIALAAAAFLPAGCDKPCVPVPCAALTLRDPEVHWRIDTFHVHVCVGAVCDDTDVPLDATTPTALPMLGGTTTMKSASMAGISAFAADVGGDDAGATVHTGDTVHVTVTNPTNGVTICDMMAPVPDPAPMLRECGSCTTRAIVF